MLSKVILVWKNKSQSAKSAIVFTFAILLSRALAFITTPIFTRLMPPDQIGIVGLYTSSFAILSSITSLGLTSGGFMVGMKDFEDNRDQYISSILSLTTLASLIFFLSFCITPSLWTNLLGLPKGLIFLMIIGCILTPSYEFWLMRQRYEYAYKKAALITVLTSFISTALAVVAIILTKDIPDILGEVRLYISIGTCLAVYFVFWIIQLKRGGCFYNRLFWSSSLILGLPLLGHSFASQILNVSDRIFIGKFVNNSSVGIYSTLYAVASLVLMLWGAINSSFVPYLFQNIENEGRRFNVSKTVLQLLMLFSAITISVSIMAPEVVKILAPPQYLKHVQIIPPMLAGVYTIALSNLYSNILVFCKNTLAIMLSTIIACIVSVLLNFILIPKFGFEIAAYNTFLSYIVFVLLQIIYSYKVFRKKYEGAFVYANHKIFLVSIVTIALSFFCINLYEYTFFRYLIIVIMWFVIACIYYRNFK